MEGHPLHFLTLQLPALLECSLSLLSSCIPFFFLIVTSHAPGTNQKPY